MNKPDDGCGPAVSGGLKEDGLSCLRQYHSSFPRISECMDSEAETVMQLRNELRDKEMKLTDIRLEALNSAHQLDQLRETMHNMQVGGLAAGGGGRCPHQSLRRLLWGHGVGTAGDMSLLLTAPSVLAPVGGGPTESRE